MSMLAERKRKTKWVLLPKSGPGKPLWSTDNEGVKFGKKLMEKMGWSAGKGLGANEQGIQEPLRVSYKNDTKGMGFKLNDDEWISQQDEFNDLLNQLSGSSEPTPGAGGIDTQKLEIKSLEEKSKKSRSRVHYKKFTRGKDLSRYSENDLACILGTNKIKPEVATNGEKPEVECETEKEPTFGVKTIHGGSLVDYFSTKWADIKKQRQKNKIQNGDSKETIEGTNEDCSNNNSIESETELTKKLKKKKRKHSSPSDAEPDNSNECDNSFGTDGPCKKKSKTNKSYTSESDIERPLHSIENNGSVNDTSKSVVEEKSDSSHENNIRKRKQKVEGEVDIISQEEEISKMHKKRKSELAPTVAVEIMESNKSNESTKKKKKKTKEIENMEVVNSSEKKSETEKICDNEKVKTKKKHKKDKSKKKDLETENDVSVMPDGEKESAVVNGKNKEEDEVIPKKKKKRKHKDGNLSDVECKTNKKEKEKQRGEQTPANDQGRQEEENLTQSPDEVTRDERIKKKKKKDKTKENVPSEENGNCVSDEVVEEKRTKKVKCKKEKIVEGSEQEEAVRESESKPSAQNAPEETNIIHSHKKSLFYKKERPLLPAGVTSSKALKLFYGAQIQDFKGSNLADLAGYGKAIKKATSSCPEENVKLTTSTQS
ncbi:hypothetical protein RUM44_003704 [Polyplax serrata]|uniref:G-patch domain-containing protein n=1 Tax=Polyplax serrata TaxID=468196 RepID=A0ABR1AH81_POLSC